MSVFLLNYSGCSCYDSNDNEMHDFSFIMSCFSSIDWHYEARRAHVPFDTNRMWLWGLWELGSVPTIPDAFSCHSSVWRWYGPQGGERLRANSGFELHGTKRAQARQPKQGAVTRAAPYSARKIELGQTPSCSPKSDKLRGLTTHICTDVRRTHKHGPRQGSAPECDARCYSERSRCDNTDPLLSAMISHTNNTNITSRKTHL